MSLAIPSGIYPWQESEWKQLQTMLSNDRLPHALLLAGLKGTGLLEFSNLFATSILCENPNESGESCLQCAGCKLIRAETHPDLLFISPEEEWKAIKIDQIRSLVKFTQLQSHTGKRKIIILHPAEAMNISAANGLLKTLEEPPGDTLILLVSHHASALPITIRSRCQKIKISASSMHVREWLIGKCDNNLIETVLASGCGPLFLDEIEHSEAVVADRLSLLSDLENITNGQYDPVEAAEQWSKLELGDTLFWLIKIVQDVIKLKLTGDANIKGNNLINEDILKRIIKLVENIDIKGIFSFYDKLLEYQKLLSYNSSLKALTIMEDLTLEWERLR
ncbi:MAG: DNA polymerase III subunit delta' [Gammaproteobacteria bacterium]